MAILHIGGAKQVSLPNRGGILAEAIDDPTGKKAAALLAKRLRERAPANDENPT